MDNFKQVVNNFIPVTNNLANLLDKDKLSNLSLYTQRMVYWKYNYTREELSVNKVLTFDKIYEKSKNYFNSGTIKSLINNKNKLQEDYISSLKEDNILTLSISAKTASPFITGLGSGHPTETGIVLDRNTGLPYIPSTSVKGVLRLSYALNMAKERGEESILEKDLEKYFGYQDDKGKRSQLMILDVFPCIKNTNDEDINFLKKDIMTPHLPSYYSGTDKRGPEEKNNPNPIPFIVVPEGVTFTFRCAVLPVDGEKIDFSLAEKEIKAMFKTAFETIGFGAKTAIGYGRFTEVQ